MTVPPHEPASPPEAWYRRYWAYPYPGCGCLWTVMGAAILWWLLSLLFPPLAFWNPTAAPAEPRARSISTGHGASFESTAAPRPFRHCGKDAKG